MTAPRVPRQGPGLQGPRRPGSLPYPQAPAKSRATGRAGPAPGRWQWYGWVLAALAAELALTYWASTRG